ncbi:MAG TPA: Ig-like domain-containing protein [Acetivibrio thermocellus]|nr:Ig-like domain-containing protein [Acetivibrio thermocellus]
MKKTISLLVISMLIIGILFPFTGNKFAFAEEDNRKNNIFEDITGHWCEEFILKFYHRNWVFGYDDGLFYPDKFVTRAEFTAMVVNIFKKRDITENNASEGKGVFTDMSEKDWFYNAVKYAAEENLIKGFEDGTFKPYNNMSRQDAAVLAAQLFDVDFFIGAEDYKFEDEDTFPEYSFQSIKNLASHGIVQGYPDGTFKPFNLITRAEAVRMLDVVLKYIEVPDPTMPGGPAETPVITPVPTYTPTPEASPTVKPNSGSTYTNPKETIKPNTAPEVSFNLEKKKKLDVVFTVGKADTQKVNLYSEKIQSFKNKMSNAGVDVNISTINTQTYTSTNTFDWQEYDHYYYVDTYTNPDWPNPMPKHILFDEKNIQMVGYTVVAMKDFLFVPDTNETQKTFTFDIQRDSTNWHSIEGGGFLFNASIENNILKGYCILITADGLKLDEISGINLTMFRDGKYEYVEYAGRKLATFDIGDVYAKHSWKIVIDPESITLWDNGKLIIDNYKLPNTNYGTGFGPIISHANHSCQQMSYFTFENIEMTTIVGKSLMQAVDEFNWRDDAEHMLVSLSDELLFELSNEDKIAYIASMLLEKNVDLYSLGNETNRQQYEDVITATAGKGIFVLNDDLAMAMNGLEEYALSKFKDEDYTINKFIAKGEEVVYNKSYFDAENDPKYEEQWRYVHDPAAFENAEGLVDYNEVPMSKPVNQFEKPGDYTIFYKASDNPKNGEPRKWSDESVQNISVHRPPVVTLESRIFFNKENEGYTVNVTETAVDLDHQSEPDAGIISKEYKWKNIKDENWTYGSFPEILPADNYYIFVLTATDKEGAVSKPAVQLVSTKAIETDPDMPEDTTPPTVSLILSESSVIRGDEVTLSVNMSDDTKIAYVKATANGIPIYFDTKGYCVYKSDTVGETVIRIEVFDIAGNSAADEKILTVKEDNPPMVSISAPDTVALKQTFTISVNARDDVGVTLIETEVNGNPVVLNSSNRYTITAEELGEIIIDVKVFDRHNSSAQAQKIITVTPDTTNPSVSISASLTTVAIGQPFTITVNASDNVGVERLDVEVNGEPIVLDSSRKFTITPESVGTILIKAYAYDEAGNVSTAERKITVTEDTTPPSVSISVSTSTVIAKKEFTITVNASDNVGVTKIEAEVDGVPVVLDDNNKYTILPEEVGVITITAYAYDSKGNTGTATRQITVNPDTSNPYVSISSSSSSVVAGKSVTITVSASDNVRVVRVEAFANGVPVELDANSKCTITTETPGILEITANAYDEAGNVGTATKSITVQPDTTVPSVSISSTASTITAGKSFTITVNASDNIGVVSIEVDIDGVPISLDENNKYTVTPTEAGTIVITAKAYDKAGNEGIATRSITVQADTTKPSVSISSTASTVAVGKSFTITVNASDNIGVVSIEVDIDGVPISLDENNKYTVTPTEAGTIVITAKVYDKAGNVGTATRTVNAIFT